MARTVCAGDRFGRLVAVSPTGQKKWGYPTWNCVCDCGSETIVDVGCLRKGTTKSCGCLRREQRGSGHPRFKHGATRGHAKSAEYETWQGVLKRCTNPRSKSYRYYGGRGITVCDRWLESFENFLADMGPRPAGKTLDRIDNNGSYCPENCRWATAKQQARNKGSNRLITWRGDTKTLVEWSEETGFSYRLLKQRIRKLGWPIERALTEPVRGKRTEVA